jgi:hypothetical protein
VELRAGHDDEGLLGGGSGGVVSSSSSAFGKRFSASSSGLTVGYSKDEAVAAGAARKAVLGSGGRRTGHEAGEGGALEGYPVLDRAAVEVGVERAALVVRRKEEVARRGGGEARDVGGGLEGERKGGGGGEVGGRDAIADCREEDGGVRCEYGVTAAVRRAEEVLEAVVHGEEPEWRRGARGRD